MKVFVEPPRGKWPGLLTRPVFNEASLEENVSGLLMRIRNEGLPAILDLAEKFDNYRPEKLEAGPQEIEQASLLVDDELKRAIKKAAANIERFHLSQLSPVQVIHVAPGISCWQKDVPVESVGLYIPGGTAPLFSTVLMLGIPARIAGCREISMCTPAGKEGKIHPAILYAAGLCGIGKVFRIGGVQAIGAMAYGISPVPKADKIFGPGNQYVTMAKQLVSREGTAIDMPAGPSEVLVMADETANPLFVAADLISQAEHGPDSQVILLCRTEEFVNSVMKEFDGILKSLPRAETARKCLENSRAVVFREIGDMIDFSNAYAPEHLIISLSEAQEAAEKIINAGSVFIGNYSPESAGDYATGTNHTLPTNGYARAFSGLTTGSFMKTILFQELTREGLGSLGPDVIRMAAEEGLDGHALAVSVRLKEQRDERV